MKLWHPHTERPAVLCSCLIALPPDEGDTEFALAGNYYTYNPRTDLFRSEESDTVLIASAFFWARERDVLAELEAPR
ncbi:hypothetical protein LLG90_13550 [Aromatoleum toluclasticum]|uniref:hypothetical protein n=1 Tax=Aromatoleum toluclasticum TaxID=92003 RepID=UPI001D17EA05|nr:hypothetical protein [Aromatoleum toluclasticum]MCC4116380.1 hypothetical protein [Aromatoleum toluclasticum]